MAAAFAIGIPPDDMLDMTYRELYAAFKGHRDRSIRAHQLALYEAWHTAAFYRSKKMPELLPMLRKLEPSRVMSPKALRSVIVGAAMAMGAKVRIVKKGEL